MTEKEEIKEVNSYFHTRRQLRALFILVVIFGLWLFVYYLFTIPVTTIILSSIGYFLFKLFWYIRDKTDAFINEDGEINWDIDDE